MDVQWKLGHDMPDGSRRTSEITITMEADEDPDGHIVGLLMRDRLSAFLACYPNPGKFPASDPQEARDLLMRFAFVTKMCESRLAFLRLAARDQFNLGWGTIADATEEKRSTVKDRINSARESFADQGFWIDSDGLHEGLPEEALLHVNMTRMLSDVVTDD